MIMSHRPLGNKHFGVAESSRRTTADVSTLLRLAHHDKRFAIVGG